MRSAPRVGSLLPLAVAHQRGQIHDQGHPAISHDGGAGNDAHLAEEFSERLEHGLVRPDHAIDHQADAFSLVRHNHDLLDLRHRSVDVEHLPQIDVGDQFSAHGDHVAAVVARPLGAFQVDVFRNGRHGDNELIGPHLHQQAFDDRQRQRKEERYPRPLPPLAFDGQGTAHGVDLSFDDIHAHASPRNLCHRLGRGEAGKKNEIEQLLVAEVRLGRNELPLDGLGAHRLPADTLPIVLDADHDVRSRMRRRQPYRSPTRFAVGDTLIGRLHPVVDGVAQKVYERFAELVQNAFVELGVGAFRDQVDLFPQLRRDVVHQPGEAAENGSDRQHAYAENVVAQLADQPVHLFHRIGKVRVAVANCRLRQAGLIHDQFARPG